MTQKIIATILFYTVIFSGPANAQETLQCLIISEVLAPTIVDDKTIKLEMRGGKTLQINLTRACPQLQYHGSFSYQALRGELCVGRDHIISRAGESCGLQSITELP